MQTTVFSTIAMAWLALVPLAAFAQEHGGEHIQPTQQTEQKSTDKPQRLPLCPVMEEPIDFHVKTMTDGGLAYFCCDMCIPKFLKDPAKYSEKLANQRAAIAKLDRVQVICPVDGKEVNVQQTAEISGHKIAFCSKECQVKYSAGPESFKAKLADSYTYQTRCPISDERIQPDVFKNLSTGQRIYFCCPSCGDKLLKDPAKYAPKLAEQGVNIDPKKMTATESKSKKDDDHSGHPHP